MSTTRIFRRRLPARRLVAVAVLALWAGTLAAHIRREYVKPPSVRLAEGARALAPATYFYLVRQDGRAIGLATSRFDTVPGGFVVDDLLNLEVPLPAAVHRTTVRTRTELGPSLEVLAFRYELGSELGPYHVTGTVLSDSVLDLTIGAGPGGDRRTVPWDREWLLPAALPLRLAAGGDLVAGRRFSVPVFDPSLLVPREVTVSVLRRDAMVVTDSAVHDAATGAWSPGEPDTIPAWQLEEDYGGIRVVSWIDGDGRLIRGEHGSGLRLERQPFEVARQEWSRAQRREAP